MDRSKITVLLIVALAVCMVFTQMHSAWADEGVADGYYDSAEEVELKVEPSFVFEGAAHVANGVAQRNRVEGTIHLRGVPIGSEIVRALLYFNFMDDRERGRPTTAVVVNGIQFNANLVASSLDPCWPLPLIRCHTYLADVTAIVGNRRPNADYEVTINLRGINTNGEDPWNFTTPLGNVVLEGATMIVIYRNEDTGGTVYVYDNLSNSMFSSSGLFALFHASESGPALFTMTGADGQKSPPNETTTFNGLQIAGPGGLLSASDWDGSTGWPLPQLWDVQTHRVSLDGTSSTVVYQAGGDCLVPVAFVIDKL